jgi:hypothetical protein
MATASSRGPALRGNGPGRTMTGSMGSFVIRRVGENERTTTGVAAAAEAGRIAGLVTWHATFEYELTEAGFHSWMPTPRRGVQVAGGFHVINDAPGSCTVVHYEQYHLPSASRSIAFAWRLYVTRSMNAELERIALLAQPAPGQLSDAHDQELMSSAGSPIPHGAGC